MVDRVKPRLRLGLVLVVYRALQRQPLSRKSCKLRTLLNCAPVLWLVWSAPSASSGGRPARRVRLPMCKLETHRMWYEHGLSVEAVAEARCNKTSTILGYLAGE